MNKVTKLLGTLGAVCVVGYLGLVGYAYYFDHQRVTLPTENPASVQDMKVLEALSQHGCDYCHTASVKMPFYVKLPIAKQLMEYDINFGNKSFSLAPIRESLINGKAAPESDLAKLEWVIQHNAMPPTRFKAVHWSGILGQQDTEVLLNWVKSQRETYYATKDVSSEMCNEPVQPLPRSLPVNAQKVALGSRLYHDPRLSSDNSISCASCHDLNAGGVDGRKTSLGVGKQEGPINAPTVFNAVFNVDQFWDGRAPDLQKQAGGPPLNPIEMASKSWEEIIEKLDKDPDLKRDFVAVYPTGFTGDTITDAIAEFEKTLITPDSPFDRYLRGDKQALTAQQVHGYQLFKDNKCANCHTGKIMGGRSFEPLGLKKDFTFGEITDADIGRFNVTKEERDRLRQKVPTLRNVALTAPYFHRGDVATLDEAVKLMLEYQVGTTLPQKDVDDIVDFLTGLTGIYTPSPIKQ